MRLAGDLVGASRRALHRPPFVSYTHSRPQPPLHEKFPLGSVDLNLNTLVCKGVTIGDISSKQDDSSGSIQLGFKGIGVTCNIPDFTAKLDGVKIGSGSGSAVVSDSSITDTIQVAGSGGLVTKATNLDCSSSIQTKLHLKLNGIGTSFVNLILSWAQGEIDKTIDSAICGELNTVVDTNLTDAFLAVNQDIEPYLPPDCCEPFPAPAIPAGMIDWRDNMFVTLGDFFLDDLIGANGPLSVNTFMNKLTGNTGSLSVDLSSFAVPPVLIPGLGAKIFIKAEKLTLSGLNTFTSLRVLGPSRDEHGLNTSIAAESLNATVEASITVVLGNETVTGSNLTERFRFNLALGRVDVEAATTLAVYRNYTMDLAMGQATDLGCLARSIYGVNFTYLAMNFTTQNVELDADNGGVEKELDDALDAVLNLFLHNYETVVPDVVSGVLMYPVRTMINDKLAAIIQFLGLLPCGAPTHPEKRYIDWTNGTVGNFLEEMNNLLGVNGTLDINWVMQKLLAADDDGIVRKQGEVLRLPIQPDLTLSVRDVCFRGVPTFTNFTLLEPIDEETLTSAVEWGNVPQNTVNYSFWVDFFVPEGVNSPDGFTDSFRVELHLEDLKLEATGVCQVKEAEFSELKFGQLSNPDCVAGTLEKGGLSALGLSVKDAHMRLYGGRTEQVKNLEKALMGMDQLSSNLVNFLFELGGPFLTKGLNSFVDQKIREGPAVCASGRAPASGGGATKAAGLKGDPLFWTITGSAAAALLIGTMWLYYHTRKNGGKIAGQGFDESLLAASTKRNSSVDSRARNASQQSMDGLVDFKEPEVLFGPGSSLQQSFIGREAAAPSERASFPPWECLCTHPRIPVAMRPLVPLVLASNAALFVWSAINVGAGVKIRVQAGSVVETVPSIFDFALGNTIKDMWEAGVYPLSLLVAVFSGAWPYLKLILMGMCWLFPIGWMGVGKRETMLRFLDALGKWSLIDAYVMSLMLVAFRFSVGNPGSEIPVSFFQADVFVEPDTAFYTFLCATIVSLITTHVVLHYHRHSEAERRLPTGGECESLRNHTFDGEQFGLDARRRIRCSSCGNFIITFLLVFAIIVILAGSIVESFKFEFKGLAGLFLGESATRGYSLLSVTHAIPTASETPGGVGIIWIQSVFYLVSFVIPLTHMLLMGFLWWWPLTIKTQYVVFYISEIFNAWSALDVFVISIIAAILEIQQFAAFMVGDNCDAINVFIEDNLSQYTSPYNVCFTVIATLSNGCWILFAASVTSLIVSQIVMQKCHRAVYHRIEQLPVDESMKSMKSDRDGEVDKEPHEGRFTIWVSKKMIAWGLATVEEDEERCAGRAVGYTVSEEAPLVI